MVTSFIANQAIKKGLNFIKKPSIGSLLGGSVVSLFGRGTNASQAMKLQYNYQRLLQQQQYDLTQRGYRESPGNQRIGLEAAGYNPLLAVTNGVQYGSYSSGQSSAVSDSADQTNAISNRLNALTSIAGLKAINASADKMSEEAETEVFKRENLWQDTMLKRSMEILNNAEAPWVAKKAAAQIANLFMTGEAAIVGSNAQQLNAITGRLHYKLDDAAQNILLDKAKRYQEWGSEHPWLRNFDETVERYFHGASYSASNNTSHSTSKKLK